MATAAAAAAARAGARTFPRARAAARAPRAAAPAQRRVAARAAEAPAGAPRTAPAYSDCTRVVEKEDGLNISELSFGTIGVTVGLSMLLYGFGAFFNYLPGQSGSAPLLIYGFIISLLGSALKYAQLDPLDCRTYEDADKLRASQATDIQVQVKSDTTRYRYGDEQHLEEALERIFLFGRRAAGGIARRDSPELVGLQERVINGFYALVLVFESPKVDIAGWEGRREKIERFFGPDISCEIYERPGDLYDVCLISNGKGGSGTDSRPDALPQLMPGLQPRRGNE